MKILEEVLKKISPNEEEKKEIESVVKEIKDLIEKIKPEDAEAMLVGSVAKDTYLKNALDIDFFILFPT
ncbi:MAG: nucleotidyltransferase domain-containing protein, partial [Candidatus Thermoplasmatota archaeon]